MNEISSLETEALESSLVPLTMCRHSEKIDIVRRHSEKIEDTAYELGSNFSSDIKSAI